MYPQQVYEKKRKQKDSNSIFRILCAWGLQIKWAKRKANETIRNETRRVEKCSSVEKRGARGKTAEKKKKKKNEPTLTTTWIATIKGRGDFSGLATWKVDGNLPVLAFLLVAPLKNAQQEVRRGGRGNETEAWNWTKRDEANVMHIFWRNADTLLSFIRQRDFVGIPECHDQKARTGHGNFNLKLGIFSVEHNEIICLRTLSRSLAPSRAGPVLIVCPNGAFGRPMSILGLGQSSAFFWCNS